MKRDEGDCDQIFALAARLLRGEQLHFIDAFGNEYLATGGSIMPLPWGEAVSEGDAFEIAKHVRALISFRPPHAARAARVPVVARTGRARPSVRAFRIKSTG